MKRTARAAFTFVAVGTLVAASWSAWLGWDQQYNELPDGTASGPYEPWQVIGLIATIAVILIPAAWWLHRPAVVAATTAGLASASYYDWHHDETGLFMIGVIMITVGAFVASSIVVAIIDAITRGPAPGPNSPFNHPGPTPPAGPGLGR